MPAPCLTHAQPSGPRERLVFSKGLHARAIIGAANALTLQWRPSRPAPVRRPRHRGTDAHGHMREPPRERNGFRRRHHGADSTPPHNAAVPSQSECHHRAITVHTQHAPSHTRIVWTHTHTHTYTHSRGIARFGAEAPLARSLKVVTLRRSREGEGAAGERAASSCSPVPVCIVEAHGHDGTDEHGQTGTHGTHGRRIVGNHGAHARHASFALSGPSPQLCCGPLQVVCPEHTTSWDRTVRRCGGAGRGAGAKRAPQRPEKRRYRQHTPHHGQLAQTLEKQLHRHSRNPEVGKGTRNHNYRAAPVNFRGKTAKQL